MILVEIQVRTFKKNFSVDGHSSKLNDHQFHAKKLNNVLTDFIGGV